MNMNQGDTQLIVAECMTQGLLRNQAAYVLATAKWETAHTMEPVRETLAASDASVIARLDRAWEKGQLKWVSRPYWRGGFFGRGYVQLTHEANYRKAGSKLSVDLVGNPSLALDPVIAAQILVVGSRDGWFTGKKLSDYITLKQSNYRGARRIINGTDQASAIAELAREYEAELKLMGYGNEPVPPVVNERRDGTEPRENPIHSTTMQATLLAFLATIGQVMDGAKNAVDQVTDSFGVSAEIALLVITVGALGWVFRERLKKWTGGVR